MNAQRTPPVYSPNALSIVDAITKDISASSRAMAQQYSWVQKLVADYTRPVTAVYDAMRIDFSHMVPDHLVNLEKTFKTRIPNVEYPLSPALRASTLAKELSQLEKVALARMPNFSDQWNDFAYSLQRSLDQWATLSAEKAAQVAAHNPEVRDQAEALLESHPEEVEELSQKATGMSFAQFVAGSHAATYGGGVYMAGNVIDNKVATIIALVFIVLYEFARASRDSGDSSE